MRLHCIPRASLLTHDLATATTAYTELGLLASETAPFAQHLALDLGYAQLVNAPSVALALEATTAPIVQMIEYREAARSKPFARLGWIAIEWLVKDVFALYARLKNNPHFRILQAPKALDFTDHIVAMQVLGPCDEVLYLTEVKAPVAGFNLPLSSDLASELGPIFVAVLACRNRSESAAFYQGLGGSQQLQFDTRLSAINQAHQLPVAQQHPVATVSLSGPALLELDQLDFLSAEAADPNQLQCGILSFALQRLGTRLQSGPARILRGPNAELIELC